MGYTIYRDYPDGKFAVVSTEPSSDFDQFSKEIEAIKCFSQAPTRAEAFYQGLIEGIKSANFTNTYAQNLLVIIGDSGNHIEDSLSLEDVKAELEGKKITLFGLQTTNGAHASYLDFNQDILQLASVTSSSGKMGGGVRVQIHIQKLEQRRNRSMGNRILHLCWKCERRAHRPCADER